MPDLSHRRLGLLLAPALIVACLALAACGSSSGSSSNSSGSTAAAGAAAGGPPGSGRFAAVRACLQKNGINLPQRPPGQRPARPGGGIFGGGATGGPRGPQLPAGVTRAKFQAALQKCGGRAFRGGGFRTNPAFRQSLTAFATCMRQNGVNLPPPNTSGTGPVFNTKGINTTSKQFTAATAKCRPLLRGGFGRAGGGPPASTTGAPTPSTQ